MINPHPLDNIKTRKEYYKIHKSFKGYKTYLKLLENENKNKSE